MNNQLVELQETLYTSKNPTRRWLHCIRRDWIINALHSVVFKTDKANRSALEVGPGAGGYLPALKDIASKVVASDIEESYLEYIQSKFADDESISYVVDDITSTKIKPKSFDLILCTEVIEHIPDSQAALNSLHDLLKSDGKLILSTPQKYSPLELTAKIAFLPGIIQVVRLIYGEAIIETGHINLLTEKQLKNQLTNAGFIIEKEYKCGFYIPLIAEFMGGGGLKIEQWLENRIRGSIFDGLLWTQCYIVRPGNK